MPGFELARLLRRARSRPSARRGHDRHGAASTTGCSRSADTAQESYERMIGSSRWPRTTSSARRLRTLRRSGPAPAARRRAHRDRAACGRGSAAAAGAPIDRRASTRTRGSPRTSRGAPTSRISQRGPATPDHVIRTKRLPLVGRDVDAYVAEYRDLLRRSTARSAAPLTMLDPAPRVVLDPELGLLRGRPHRPRRRRRRRHLPAHDRRDRARRRRSEAGRRSRRRTSSTSSTGSSSRRSSRREGAPPPLAGEIALVTGAARASVAPASTLCSAPARRSSASTSTPAVDGMREGQAFLGITCDVTDEDGVDDGPRAARSARVRRARHARAQRGRVPAVAPDRRARHRRVAAHDGASTSIANGCS